MRVVLCVFALFLASLQCGLAAASDSVAILPQRPPCELEECRSRHAIFFIHGIYGDSETFKNGEFDWPKRIPQTVDGSQIDVYRIDFKTLFWDWARKHVTTLDELEEQLSAALFGVPRSVDGPGEDGILVTSNGRVVRPYKSLNIIAHSLGGNVAAALIHEVKSRYGHDRRARFGFVITLGTPANGAQIANLGGLFRWLTGLPDDPLLASLERDNTFLRMLQRWRVSEDLKAQAFACRHVNLYVAVEGKPLITLGFIRHQVVPIESASAPVRGLATKIDLFEDLDHSSIASPDSTNHKMYTWVNGIMTQEVKRLNDWPNGPLCERVSFPQW